MNTPLQSICDLACDFVTRRSLIKRHPWVHMQLAPGCRDLAPRACTRCLEHATRSALTRSARSALGILLKMYDHHPIRQCARPDLSVQSSHLLLRGGFSVLRCYDVDDFGRQFRGCNLMRQHYKREASDNYLELAAYEGFSLLRHTLRTSSITGSRSSRVNSTTWPSRWHRGCS